MDTIFIFELVNTFRFLMLVSCCVIALLGAACGGAGAVGPTARMYEDALVDRTDAVEVPGAGEENAAMARVTTGGGAAGQPAVARIIGLVLPRIF